MMKSIYNMLRISAILFTLVLFSACHSRSDRECSAKEQVLTLTSHALSSTLFYSGTIQPLKTQVITSPADGVIEEMYFHYGDSINANKILFTIASEKFQSDYKNALMQFIKAKNDFNTSHTQLMQGDFLHKNQLISDDEWNTKKNGFYNAQLGLVQAKETLTSMLKQINVKENINELNIENIEKITQALNAQGESQRLQIVSPANGVILLPSKSDNDSETKKINKGDQVKQGDVLAVVGDTNGLTIRVSVNEFNINELKLGQKVEVTGAAFPDFVLVGNIAGIDRQAIANSSSMPIFPIEIVVPHLTKKEQETIHVGMSAKVAISIEGKPELMLPLAAVFEKNGQTYVTTLNSTTGKKQEIAVKTGQTTPDEVVIESGLKSGDQVVFTR